MSLYSSSLNVLDGSPEDTQLAHSVLLVHRPSNSQKRKKPRPTLAPIQLSLTFGSGGDSVAHGHSSSETRVRPQTTQQKHRPQVDLMTGSNFGSTVQSSNHRPSKPQPKPPMPQASARPWPSRRPVFSTTFASVSSSSSTTPRSVFLADSDDEPILMKSNHRKYALPALTRTKLTSEYADFWTTTPTSFEIADNSIKSSTYNYPSQSYPSSSSPSPFTTSIVNVVSRPPLRVTSVQGTHHKEPDNVKSALLTVLDPPPGSHRLHPNTTIVHKTLIVPYKPGRPRPTASTVKPFPIYPMLAGITRRPPLNHTTTTTTGAPPASSTPDWPHPGGIASSAFHPEVTTYFPQTIFQRPTSTAGYPNKLWTGPTYESIYDPTSTSVPTSSLITHRPHPPGDFIHDAPIPTVVNVVSSSPTPSTTPEVTTFLSTSTTQQTRYPGLHPAASVVRPVVVTRRPAYRPHQVATVNAILAPPMPSRPISTPAPLGSTGIFSSMLQLFGLEGVGGIASRLTLLKTALFTLLVMFLPPLSIAAAVAALI